jgi:glycine cleavage system H protein
MSTTPIELKYAATHEWVKLEQNDTVCVGITAFAQDALGDVVFVELPEVGAAVVSRAEVAVVESVKAASDIYAPLSGEVIAVNEALDESPQLINEDPYGEGWMFRMRIDDASELEGLLSAQTYLQQCEDE